MRKELGSRVESKAKRERWEGGEKGHQGERQREEGEEERDDVGGEEGKEKG